MPTQLDILFEDNHLLVVNKPPLLATMGAEPGMSSLYIEAKQYIKEKYSKPGNVYLGIVSRLDSFVSGVIVLAKTSKSAARISEQIRRGTVEKTYWAIVPDRLAEDAGVLEHLVYKDDGLRRMIGIDPKSARQHPDAKIARLAYRKIGQHQNLAMVEVRLETGRKHQIRVQFSEIGCPVVGDRKYDSELGFPKGIALHSKSLKFDHPTLKSELSFDALPPTCWNLERFGIR